MLSSTQKTFFFAFAMCVICSMLLTGASVGLKARQQTNIKIDKQKNVLKALGVLEEGKKYLGTEVEALYKENVRNFYMNEEGHLIEEPNKFPVFALGNKDKLQSYAIPFKAYGLWSWVKGYIALKGDGDTIVGMTVYEHAETPGLGGEVEKKWFQDQFVGKKITNKSGAFVSIGVVKGKVSESIPKNRQKNYVDGISGATITGKGMEKYLKIDLEQYEPFAKRLRKG